MEVAQVRWRRGARQRGSGPVEGEKRDRFSPARKWSFAGCWPGRAAGPRLSFFVSVAVCRNSYPSTSGSIIPIYRHTDSTHHLYSLTHICSLCNFSRCVHLGSRVRAIFHNVRLKHNWLVIFRDVGVTVALPNLT